MKCTSCNFTNPEGVKFCGQCGARLSSGCAHCGAVSPPGFRFCGECGAALPTAPSRTSAHETGKVLTVVFADLIGSTALHERLDPEAVTRLMDEYYEAVRGPVTGHGGTVVQLLGAGVLCAFGIPTAHEDDALHAVRAAVGVQQEFQRFARQQHALAGAIGLRLALNTGEVVVSDEHPAGIGDPLNVAARLQQEARDGEVVIGEETRRLVGDVITLAPLGAITLKGRAEAVAAYRVVSLDRSARVAAVAFVGRDDELRRITAVYDAAVSAPAARSAGERLEGAPDAGGGLRPRDHHARALRGWDPTDPTGGPRHRLSHVAVAGVASPLATDHPRRVTRGLPEMVVARSTEHPSALRDDFLNGLLGVQGDHR